MKPTPCLYTVHDEHFTAKESLNQHKQMPSSFEAKTKVDTRPNDVTKTSHVRPTPHFSTVCDEHFATKENLNEHKRIHSSFETEIDSRPNDVMEHPHVKPMPCLNTVSHEHSITKERLNQQKQMPSSYEARTYVDSKPNDVTEYPHVKPTPHLCTECDERFTTEERLNEHKQVHHGNKLYSCTWCEKSFVTQEYLTEHMNVHSICSECGNHFNGKQPHKCPVPVSEVVSSQSMHTNTDMGDKSSCRSDTLPPREIQVHHNRGPYKCYSCGKLFKGSWKLKRHVRMHAAKPYSCTHCSDCFKTPDKLKNHLRKSHNEGTVIVLHAIIAGQNFFWDRSFFSATNSLCPSIYLKLWVHWHTASECFCSDLCRQTTIFIILKMYFSQFDFDFEFFSVSGLKHLKHSLSLSQ